MAVLATLLVGCGVEAPYPTDLKPCDLLTTKAADTILGTGGKLGPPKAEKSSFLHAANVYCTWTFEEDPALLPIFAGRPKRRLAIDLVVYSADSGGAKAAAESVHHGRDKAQKVVPGIGDYAIGWSSEVAWPTSYLTFQRSNAVVSLDVTGFDDTADQHEQDLPDTQLVTMVTQAARQIDRKLVSLR